MAVKYAQLRRIDNNRRLVRDGDAMQMLQTAIRSLPLDLDALAHNVASLAAKAIREGEQGVQRTSKGSAGNRSGSSGKKKRRLTAIFRGNLLRGHADHAPPVRRPVCLAARTLGHPGTRSAGPCGTVQVPL